MSAGAPPAVQPDLVALKRAAALKYGVDPDIFARQLHTEDPTGDPNAVSPKGAVGVAQLMPGTAKELGVDPHDSAASIDAAARLMRQHLDRYKGDYRLALAAYNAGQGNVEKAGGVPNYPETQGYLQRAMPTHAPRDIAELGRLAKAKFPGSYANWPDSALGEAIKRKGQARDPNAYANFGAAPEAGGTPIVAATAPAPAAAGVSRATPSPDTASQRLPGVVAAQQQDQRHQLAVMRAFPEALPHGQEGPPAPGQPSFETASERLAKFESLSPAAKAALRVSRGIVGTLPGTEAQGRERRAFIPEPANTAERLQEGAGGALTFGAEAAGLSLIPGVGPMAAAALPAIAQPGTTEQRTARGLTMAAASLAGPAAAPLGPAAEHAAGIVSFGGVAPWVETAAHRLLGQKDAPWPTAREMVENVGLLAGLSAGAHFAGRAVAGAQPKLDPAKVRGFRAIERHLADPGFHPEVQASEHAKLRSESARASAELNKQLAGTRITFQRGGSTVSGDFAYGRIYPYPGEVAQVRLVVHDPASGQMVPFAFRDLSALRDAVAARPEPGVETRTPVPKPATAEGQPPSEPVAAAPSQPPNPAESLLRGIAKGISRAAREQRGAEKAIAEARAADARQPTGPVARVLEIIKLAEPLRAKQERLRSEEKGQRAAKARAVGQRVQGEKGFYAELGQLKGEHTKVPWEAREQMAQADVDALFRQVAEHPDLQYFETISARKGLEKLLGFGEVPTPSELTLLEKVFGEDFVTTVLKQRPALVRLRELSYEIANVPRAYMASFDLSAPFRQGLFLGASYPGHFVRAFREMFQSFASEKGFHAVMDEIASRPTYELMRRSGLALTEVGRSPTAREEQFMGAMLAEKRGPVSGAIGATVGAATGLVLGGPAGAAIGAPVGYVLGPRGVRASNRAYSGFLNKLRADAFDSLVGDYLRKSGKEGPAGLRSITADTKAVRAISEFVNTASGRGDGRFLRDHMVGLNAVFFSPRFIASRVKLLNPAYYATLDPAVRLAAWRGAFALGSFWITATSLAVLAGAKVGNDALKSDFGKIRVGNTYYDIAGGFQQFIRFAAEMAKGPPKGNRWDTFTRFAESKTTPLVSYAIGYLRGTNMLGQKFKPGPEALQRMVPMALSDAWDVTKERGFIGPVMAAPGVFGVGVQTFRPRTRR